MLNKYASFLDGYPDHDNKTLSELESAFSQAQKSKDSDSSDKQPADHLPSLRLVENMGLVFQAVDTLPPNHRSYIFPRVREMSEGMAKYTTLASGIQSDVSFLKDEADWDRYCYYVAGTVGHMLTDLFSDYTGFSSSTREKLHVLGRSFGLGLQKVNILKDAVIDTKRGICFLPQTIIDNYNISFDSKSIIDFRGDLTGLVREVVSICRRHFNDSIEYIKIIPRKHLGLRMFLIVPVMLAAGTLRLFVDYPQRLLEKGDLKLARAEVWKLVRRASYCRFSNRLLVHSFGKLYPA